MYSKNLFVFLILIWYFVYVAHNVKQTVHLIFLYDCTFSVAMILIFILLQQSLLQLEMKRLSFLLPSNETTGIDQRVTSVTFSYSSLEINANSDRVRPPCVVHMRLRTNSVDDLHNWLQLFSDHTRTNYVTYRDRVCNGRMLVYSKRYRCQLSSLHKRKDSSRDLACRASIHLRL